MSFAQFHDRSPRAGSNFLTSAHIMTSRCARCHFSCGIIDGPLRGPWFGVFSLSGGDGYPPSFPWVRENILGKKMADLRQARMFGWEEKTSPPPSTFMTDARQVFVRFFTLLSPTEVGQLEHTFLVNTTGLSWSCGHHVCWLSYLQGTRQKFTFEWTGRCLEWVGGASAHASFWSSQ